MAAIRALTFGEALRRAGEELDSFICKASAGEAGKEEGRDQFHSGNRAEMNRPPTYYTAMGKPFSKDS